MKHLMSGNEATARGVYEAGIKICSAYPGTPSTEILENLPQYKDDVYCEWAPNEKVATEVAYGASIAGSRSFCTMKMVGLNVAADPLFTAGYMGVGGAFIVVTADDPSCHSSQNEQDNRHYARAAKIAMVEPSDAQECKDFVALACEVSELFDTPVLYRTTTRVCHSKGLVEFGQRTEHTHAPYARNVRKFVCTPAHAYANHPLVEERLEKLREYGCTRALENGLNKLEMGDGRVGVITASIAYEYAKEVFPEGTSFLKLGLTFPLPMDLIRDFASKVEKLYVIEELEPFMEDQIKAAGIPCVGKELTGLLYELNTQLLRQRVLGQKADYRTVDVAPANRPPALCPGCPHRGFFYTLSKNKNYVVTGDIGCYTLGCAAPLNCMDSVVCMGAGFSAGMGIAKSFEKEGVTGKVVFGVVGDSTFFHSGMTGAAEIVYNKGHMIPCVLDNRITGMTGHQDNPGTGYTLQGDPTALLSVEKILTALGFAPVLTVDPQDLKAMKAAVDQAVAALDAGQQPAIVTRRPCLLIKRDKFRKGMCRVNADKCRSCRSCLKVGCPAISLENGKAVIDRTQCVGCTVCAQVCPFDAIEVRGGLARVNASKCTGCGKCAETCPRNVLELVPARARGMVFCSTKDRLKAVTEVCKVGCIKCGRCVKSCPADAVTLENDRIHINHKVCLTYGPECGEACAAACAREALRVLCPSAPLKSEAPAGATSAPGKPLDAKSAAQAAPASQGKAAPAPVQSAPAAPEAAPAPAAKENVS